MKREHLIGTPDALVDARGWAASVARVLMLALAVLAVALVVWPSDAWLAHWPSWSGIWSGRVSLAIGNTTAIFAAALAGVLLIRRDANAGAMPLATSLVVAAVAWGVMTGPSIPMQAALVLSLMLVSISALVRFTVVYPHRFTAEELHARIAGSATRRVRRGAHREDPLGALAEAPDQWAQRWVFALLGARRYRRIAHRMQRISKFANPAADMDRFTLWLLRAAENPWRVTLLTILLVIGISIAKPETDWVPVALAVVVSTFVVMALLATTVIAREGYLAADKHTKNRALWIMEGFIAAYVLVFLATACVPLGALLNSPEVFGAAPVGIMLAALAFTLCVMVSVFFHGALDAGLMIRRTVFAGLFGGLLAFLFAVIEQVVTTMISESFDLPASTGLFVSGAIAAGVFGPLWQSVNKWISRRLPA